MSSVFSSIIAGEIPAAFVHTDDRSVAFLSINPLNPGHTLVVPRNEIDDWLECPPDLRDHLMGVAARIGAAINAEWRPTKVALMIVGMEVPHLHIHLVPIWGEGELEFANAAPAVALEDLEIVAGRIRERLDDPSG
jgi:diadenosine tetraphosphate (Ap4A) HIT family hydrolase